MPERTLRECTIEEMAIAAHRLMRVKQISGEAALSLIVWPDQRDMHRFLKRELAQKKFVIPERLAA